MDEIKNSTSSNSTNEKQATNHDYPDKFDSILAFLFNKNTRTELLDWCKKYLATCVLIISGLGSAIQIFELGKINIAYIRFFSPTQIIPDGALVIATLILLILAYKILKSTLLGEDVLLAIENNINDKKLSKGKADLRSIPYFLAPVVFYGIMTFVGFYHFKENIFLSIIGISILYVYMGASFVYSYHYYEYLKTTPDTFKFKDTLLGISNWIRPTIILMVTASFLALAILSISAYKLPANLENYAKVDQQVHKDYKNIKSHKILYFNDTYLFVEIHRTDRKTVAVYETAGVFFDKNIIVTQANNSLSRDP